MENRIQYNSEFNSSISTYVVYETDSDYPVLKQHFDVCGFGFMVPGKSIVIIDGEKVANYDLLKWVEAHEISHYMLNHSSEYDANEEIEADLGAYILLEKYLYQNSCDMIKEYFQQRHGIDFPNDRLGEILKKFRLYSRHKDFFIS